METNKKTASQQIDDIVHMHDDWKGKTLTELRAIILDAQPGLVEEIKWRKPTRPEGVPVWTFNGSNVCVADILKHAVRITFSKGAQVSDPDGVFNERMDSKTVRAMEFYEDSTIDSAAIKKIVVKAAQLNT